jgi:hypothetical protein
MVVGRQDQDAHTSKYTYSFMLDSHHTIHGIALGPDLIYPSTSKSYVMYPESPIPPRGTARRGPTMTPLVQDLVLTNKIGV